LEVYRALLCRNRALSGPEGGGYFRAFLGRKTDLLGIFRALVGRKTAHVCIELLRYLHSLYLVTIWFVNVSLSGS